MIDALASRDGPRLAQIMRQHLRRKGEAVLENLKLATNASDDISTAEIVSPSNTTEDT